MPDKTTVKRRPVDSWFWELFVRACGGRCCVCSKDGALHRGHIQRHADGGEPIFENLIPLCKSCNSKYKGGFTPDGRPAGWRDVFLKLLLAEMNLGIMCKHIQTCVDTSLAGKPPETTGLMDLRNVEFVFQIHYSTRNARTPTSRPMRPVVAEKLIWALFEKSRENPIPPKPPLRKRQDQMKQLAIRCGSEAFKIAGDQFLREEPCPWVVGGEERGYAQADSWQHFCDCFPMYLEAGQKRAARIAKEEKLRWERERVQQEESRIAASEHRWRDYLLVAAVPSYPGIPEADWEYATAVAAQQAANAEVQDVTDERIERSLAVFRRYKLHKADELLTEKQKLRHLLTQCGRWAKRYDTDAQQDYAKRMRDLLEWIDAATIEELRKYSWWVTELHDSLDPERIAASRIATENGLF
jgi:hypothetical protein